MAEWRLFSNWPSRALRDRLDALPTRQVNFDADESQMTGDQGWRHYQSEAVIANEREGAAIFDRARVALASYQFSDPGIVVAHFDPATPLLMRRLLLEIKVLGLHYLCPAVVHKVRDEPGVFGFRYDTLEGHIERGETVEQAAIREVEEEAGVVATINEPVGSLEFRNARGPVRAQFFVMTFVSEEEPRENRRRAWFTAEEARQALGYEDSRLLVAKAKQIWTTKNG